MSAGKEPPRGGPELDAEQEVDFGKYWRAVAARWWLVVVGVVVGALIGLAATTGGSRPYDARAVVYLGQPFAPGASSPIQTLPTQFGLANQFLVSRAVMTKAAAAAGVKRSRLRSATSTKTITGFTQGKTQQPAALLEIDVSGLGAGEAVRAAQSLAEQLVADFSRFVDVKLGVYDRRLARTNRELAYVRAAIEKAERQQAALIANTSLPPTEKLLLLANLNNVIEFNQNRETTLEGTQLTLQELTALANQVERASIVDPATATRASAPSRRVGIVVGAVIGLIVGVIAALLWDPVARRWRARQATSQ